MLKRILHQAREFCGTIKFSHSLFALPFALGAAVLADPPRPDLAALGLIIACMVAARTAAMGMNRVADAALDARNPRTADRAIPAGRLSRRAALALTLIAGAAFLGLAWVFLPLRDNLWPGLLAPGVLAILFGYSWTKRFTALTHWVLGLSLGMAPVGAWIALRGSVDAVPILLGAAVLFWTAGFDILYAFQDTEVDRREGLHSVPARLGPAAARLLAMGSHAATVLLLARVLVVDSALGDRRVLGPASLVALVAIAALLAAQHVRARRMTPREIGAAFFRTNAAVSMIWLAGVAGDVFVLPR